MPLVCSDPSRRYLEKRIKVHCQGIENIGSTLWRVACLDNKYYVLQELGKIEVHLKQG